MKKKTTTKSMKYKISKHFSSNLTKKEFNKLLWNIQNETRFVLNKSIEENYNWMCFSQNYKKQNDMFPKVEEFHPYKTLASVIYNKIKEDIKYSNSNTMSSSIKDACDKYKTYQKDILRGDKAIPHYKNSCPILIHKRDVKIRKEDNNYIAKISLLQKVCL